LKTWSIKTSWNAGDKDLARIVNFEVLGNDVGFGHGGKYVEKVCLEGGSAKKSSPYTPPANGL